MAHNQFLISNNFTSYSIFAYYSFSICYVRATAYFRCFKLYSRYDAFKLKKR